MIFNDVEILQWVKSLPEGTIDLFSSGMKSPEMLSDLHLGTNDLPLTGDNHYGNPRLKSLIAQQYGVSKDNIAITPGASMANFAVLGVLAPLVKSISIETPVYQPFIRIAQTLGATPPKSILRRSEGNYSLDLAFLDFSKHPEVILISNPHNPSGRFESHDKLKLIAERWVRNNGWLIVDEIFLSFMKNGERESAAQKHERIITTNSLTKVWGLSGLRIGWVIGMPEICRKVEFLMDSLHMVQPFITEHIAEMLFQNKSMLYSLLEAARQVSKVNLIPVLDELKKHTQLYFHKPDAGISMLIRFKDGRNSDQFCQQLLTKFNTAVFPGKYFNVHDGFRLSYGCEKLELMKGLDALNKALNEFEL